MVESDCTRYSSKGVQIWSDAFVGSADCNDGRFLSYRQYLVQRSFSSTLINVSLSRNRYQPTDRR